MIRIVCVRSEGNHLIVRRLGIRIYRNTKSFFYFISVLICMEII